MKLALTWTWFQILALSLLLAVARAFLAAELGQWVGAVPFPYPRASFTTKNATCSPA